MPWLYVIAAGLMEVAWALGLKASEGFTRPWVTLFTVIGMIGSFVLLSQGMKALPVGTAYSVWTGIGAVGSVLFGIIVFGESRSWPRLFCLALIVAGIVGLRWVDER